MNAISDEAAKKLLVFLVEKAVPRILAEKRLAERLLESKSG